MEFRDLGSFGAGCLVTFLISRLTPPQTILIAGGGIFSAIALAVGISFKEKTSTVLNSIPLIIFVILAVYSQKVIGFSREIRMRNLLPPGKFLHEIYTPYQHILIGELPSQIVLLSNGEIIESFPEVIDADSESALFVAEADLPDHILVLGIGSENLISSLLKFQIKSITYCFKDQVYYDVLHSSLPEDLKQTLDDERLKIAINTPRLFLEEQLALQNQKDNKFDLIIVNTSDPSNLNINALFTIEFYSLVKASLSERGVIATRISSAENYIGEEIKNYGSSVYYTLKESFSKIVIVPGQINWFLAGSESSPLTENASILETRLDKLIPSKFSFPATGFRSLFNKERVQFTKDMYTDNSLFSKGELLNRDERPLTFFLNLLVMSRYSSSFLTIFFKSILLVGISIFLIPLLIFFVARLFFLLRIQNIKSRNLLFYGKLFQFLSGFLGFSFHLVLIFIFQTKFGTIFQLIGLLNSIFMLGLFTGGLIGRRIIKKFPLAKSIILLLSIQSAIILVSYPVLSMLRLNPNIVFALFIFFFLTTGTLTGSSYPLCAELFRQHKLSLIRTAVHLEILDHWGGSLAGLFTGLLLLPLLGVFNTLLVLFLICIALLFFFLLEIIPSSLFKKVRQRRRLTFPYIRTTIVLLSISASLIINTYLMERKRDTQAEKLALIITMTGKNYIRQKIPFPAYKSSLEEVTTYVLDSEDFTNPVRGFAGPIDILIAVDPYGELQKIKVAKHRETPSYVRGMDEFLSRFIGHNIGQSFLLGTAIATGKDDEETNQQRESQAVEIDAMTGATVTSRALIRIVNQTGQKYKELKRIEAPQETAGRSWSLTVDAPSIALILFTLTAIVLYIRFPSNKSLKMTFLFLLVFVLGFLFNSTFSFFHLSNLLTFNPPSLSLLSVILIYLVPIILGILCGPLWCGWLCPLGALQELLGSTKLSMPIAKDLDRKARYFKYVFLAFFIAVVCFNREASLFKQEPLTTFFLIFKEPSFDKLLGIAVLFLSIFFMRFWCRYFCVSGAFLSLFNKISILKRLFLKNYPSCPLGVTGSHDMDCIQCNLCLHTQRKGFKQNETG